MLNKLLKTSLILFSVFLAGLPSICSALEISPTSLTFNGSSQLQTIHLYNESNKAVTFQATAYLWSLDNNKKVLKSTEDLFPSPSIFTIPPQKSQDLRVGLFKKNQSNKVTTYRIKLEEISSGKANSRNDTISILYNITLPVFAKPIKPVKTSWSWKKVNDGLVFTNTGGNVLSFSALSYSDSKGKKHSLTPIRYVLPGESNTFKISKGLHAVTISQTLSDFSSTKHSQVKL